MKIIKTYEELMNDPKQRAEAKDVNWTLYKAYRDSRKAGTDDLNFSDIIWDEDIESILVTCRKEGIERITISSTFSSLTEVLWELCQCGCSLDGMRSIPTQFKRYDSEQDKEVTEYRPALVVKIG